MIRRTRDRFFDRCLRRFAKHHRPDWDTLNMILERIDQMSARSDAILAKIGANNDALMALGVAVDALNEGHATIEEMIADLKAQVVAGNEADFGPIEAKVEEQGSLIKGTRDAVVKGTDFEPSNN